MAQLKCTVVCLVILLAHLELDPVQSLPSSFNITKCPPLVTTTCSQEPDYNCRDDQDCGKGLKCCYDCGWNCVKPIVAEVDPIRTVKSYEKMLSSRLVAKCPTSPPSRYSPPGPDQECQNDAICDDKYPGQGLKCCKDGRDFRCMAPVVEPVIQGYCPIPKSLNSRDCPNYPESECIDDAHCQLKYPALKSIISCCPNKCGDGLRSCTILVPGSRGKCPVFPRAPECPPDLEHDCNNDQDCDVLFPGQDYKCCKEWCERICMRGLLVE